MEGGVDRCSDSFGIDAHFSLGVSENRQTDRHTRWIGQREFASLLAS